MNKFNRIVLSLLLGLLALLKLSVISPVYATESTSTPSSTTPTITETSSPAPSTQPTSTPSTTPEPSSNPSPKPSTQPTVSPQPSVAPSASPLPSASPTKQDQTASTSATVQTPTSSPSPAPSTSPGSTPTPSAPPTTVLQGSPITNTSNLIINHPYDLLFGGGSKIVFNSLPAGSWSFNSKAINLDQNQIRSLGAVSNQAFEITSNLTNGTFSYDLTLPLPTGVNSHNLAVKYGSSFSSLDGSTSNITYNGDGTITIHNLNHFTIFVVVSPNTQVNCNTVSIGTTPGSTCFATVQAAVDAASSGDTIDVGSGTYNESVYVTKSLSFVGVNTGSGNPSITSLIFWNTNITVSNISTSIVNGLPNISSVTNPIKISNQSSVSINGTGLANSNFSYTISDGVHPSLTGTGTVNGSGNFSISGINVSTLNDGTLTVSVSLNDGNGHTSSSSTTSTFKDTVAPASPTVNITNPVNISNVTNVTVSGTGETGSTATYSISDGSNPAVTGTVSVNSSGNYSATGINLSGLNQGSITVSVFLTDSVGNTSSTTTANSSIDTIAPVLNTVSISSNNTNSSSLAKTGDTVRLNFTSSESIQTPTVSILGHSATVVNLGGNSWKGTYTLTNLDTQGVVTFSINFSDLAGNAGTSVSATTDSSSVTFDKTPPTLTSTTVTTSNLNSSYAKVGDTITLNFTSSEALLTPTVTIAGHSVSVTNLGGNTWQATYIMTNTDTEGLIGYTINFSDLAGNAGTPVNTNSTIIFDKTPPTLISTSISSSNTNSGFAKVGDTITLNFTTSEAVTTPIVTIAGNSVSVTNIGGNNWRAVYTMALTDSEGAINYTISYFDLAGNPGNPVNTNSAISFDKTPPTTLDNASSTWTNTTVTVTLSCSDNISGCAHTYYTTDGSVPTTSSAQGTVITLSAQGVYTIKYFSVDNAGNPETVKTAANQVRIDLTAPTASSNNVIPGWFTSNPTITLSVSDTGGSGLNNVRYNWDSAASASVGTVFTNGTTINIPSDGSHTLFIYADDIAGNPFTYSAVYRLDTVNPTASATGSSSSWQQSAPVITISASDTLPGSGVASVTYSWDSGAAVTTSNGANISATLPGDGIHTLVVTVTDNAGRVGTFTGTYMIDRVDPTVSATGSSPSWQTSLPSMVVTASDTLPGSGVFQIRYAWDAGTLQLVTNGTDLSSTFPGDGTHTLHLIVTDNAGRVGSFNGTYMIDRGLPSTVNNISNLWSNTTVTITFTCTDITSGCNRVYYTTDGSTPTISSSSLAYSSGTASFTLSTQGVYTVKYFSTDVAGNLEAVQTATNQVMIDTQAPTTTDNAPSGWHNHPITVTLNCTDNLSGCKNVIYTTDGTDPTTSPSRIVVNGASAVFTLSIDGTYTIKYYSIDNAGNPETVKTAVNQVMIDTVPPLPPVVTMSNPINIANKNGVLVTITGEVGTTYNYTISDGVSSATGTGILTTGSVSLSVNVSSLSDGNLTLSVTLTDPATNVSTPSTATSHKDTVAPTLTLVNIVSNYQNPTIAGPSNVLTLTFTSSEAIQNPTVTINGHLVTATNTAGNTWVATYTATSSEPVAQFTFSISFSDLVGNPGLSVSSTSDGSLVIFRNPPQTPSTPVSGGGSAPTPDQKPGGAPTLTSVTQSSNTEVVLTWAKAKDPVSAYGIAYGLSGSKMEFGVPNVGNVLTYKIGGLTPGVTYFFKVFAINGNSAGDSSNVLSNKATISAPKPASNSAQNILGAITNALIPTAQAAENNPASSSTPQGSVSVPGASISPSASPASKSGILELLGNNKKALVLAGIGLVLLSGLLFAPNPPKKP